jgi:hypothetical protein
MTISEQTALPSPLVKVSDYRWPEGWMVVNRDEQAQRYCERLEHGCILCFASTAFELPEAEREFLVSQKQSGSRFHKNVSYRPERDLLVGAEDDSDGRTRLHEIMRRYSRAVTGLIDNLLLPYAGRRKLDYASFRPIEEKGRKLSLHKRNDLLHYDAFPSRPTRGGRILRVFTNVNPSRERVWLTGNEFHTLAPELAHAAGLENFATPGALDGFTRALSKLGLPFPDRAPYDRFMLHFHNWLKENREFQEKTSKVRTAFPSGCTWLVYTDGVPHAVLSGQYTLEQTFIIPPSALVSPEVSPIGVLERLAGKKMA